jgi:hypothetical protein
MVSVSLSVTRFVVKLAPTVDVVCDGLKAPLQKRVTSEVFPTPCEPRTTIFASREDMLEGWGRGQTVRPKKDVSWL